MHLQLWNNSRIMFDHLLCKMSSKSSENLETLERECCVSKGGRWKSVLDSHHLQALWQLCIKIGILLSLLRLSNTSRNHEKTLHCSIHKCRLNPDHAKKKPHVNTIQKCCHLVGESSFEMNCVQSNQNYISEMDPSTSLLSSPTFTDCG